MHYAEVYTRKLFKYAHQFSYQFGALTFFLNLFCVCAVALFAVYSTLLTMHSIAHSIAHVFHESRLPDRTENDCNALCESAEYLKCCENRVRENSIEIQKKRYGPMI